MKKISLFLFLAFSILFIGSCGDGDDPVPVSDKYVTNADCSKVPAVNTYETTIKPILSASCASAGCHDTKSAAKGIILDTYEDAKKTFAVGAKGLCSINHDGCADNMPLGGSKLSQDVLNLFACWVKNNTPK
jgi:hypothetical protein